MSKVSEIEQLLEKYYNGETSLDEESQLQAFFEGEAVPDHLESYKTQFTVGSVFKNQKSKLNEDALFSRIEEPAKVIPMNAWYKSVWVGRVAAAVALILVGYFAGGKLSQDDQLNEVKAELNQMKSLMFEQLDSKSASGRLQAVNYSHDIQNPDKETINVLVNIMLNDKSMHVRTAAVEALVSFKDQQQIGDAFAMALEKETDPAVQIAIINAMVSLKDKQNLDALEEVTKSDSVLKEVKDEAHLGIFKLREL